MNITVGTCGNCGGPVTTPQSWCGILPPPMHCEHCGSKPASHGPIIEMQKPSNQTDNSNMFIGPGLVPFEAKEMTSLDSECSRVLAENLWDLYVTDKP